LLTNLQSKVADSSRRASDANVMTE